MKYRIRETRLGWMDQFFAERLRDNTWEIVPCAPIFQSLHEAKRWLDALTAVAKPDIIHDYP